MINSDKDHYNIENTKSEFYNDFVKTEKLIFDISNGEGRLPTILQKDAVSQKYMFLRLELIHQNAYKHATPDEKVLI